MGLNHLDFVTVLDQWSGVVSEVVTVISHWRHAAWRSCCDGPSGSRWHQISSVPDLCCNVVLLVHKQPQWSHTQSKSK